VAVAGAAYTGWEIGEWIGGQSIDGFTVDDVVEQMWESRLEPDTGSLGMDLPLLPGISPYSQQSQNAPSSEAAQQLAQYHNQEVQAPTSISGAPELVAAHSGAMPPSLAGVQVNKAAGDAWSEAVGMGLKASHPVAVPEITVRTASGVRTRIDWIAVDASGQFICVECKASLTAPLTPNQEVAHPEIAISGGIVAGKGKPGVPGGTVIPPTVVGVWRP
jgi:hypothetical protein